MNTLWTLPELVSEVAKHIAALPAPRNGQVRAIPDDRTVRYYVTLGLLDRPSAVRGRTALYGPKHVAQVVAIKRLQAQGRSLSEIQGLWPTLDDRTLARMSGVELEAKAKAAARSGFWKREPKPSAAAEAAGAAEAAAADILVAEAAALESAGALGEGAGGQPVIEDARDGDTIGAARIVEASGAAVAGSAPRTALPGTKDVRTAPGAVELRIELAPHIVLSLSVVESVAISPADVRALRAAAAPLLAELATRRLAPHPGGEEP